jgi:3'(2'), 5'-bisphosphate nucleotidase
MAEARLDVYPRFAPTSEWDTAAGQCVLGMRRRRVLTLDGEPLRYNTRIRC